MIEKVIIVGGGRMGMSHYSTIKGLFPRIDIVMVETSFLMRMILSKMGFKVRSKIPEAEVPGSAVSITTGTGSHLAVASEVAKHRPAKIFVEKPLTGNADQSKQLLDLYEPMNIATQVGFVYRYQSRFSGFRSRYQTTDIGGTYDLSFLNSVMCKPNRTWRAFEGQGGGVLNDFGSHALDLVTFLYGEIIDITEIERIRTSSVDTEDIVRCGVQHEHCSGQILLDWTDASVRKTTVTLNHQTDTGTFLIDENGLQKDGAAVDLGIEQVGFYLRGNEFSLQMNDFVSGGYGNVGATFRDGAKVDALIDCIKQGGLIDGD